VKYLIDALVIWNVISFFQFGIDKYKAIKNKRRISEKTLVLSAFFLGGVGSLLGMFVFHHKTKHMKFKLLIPLAVVINLMIIGGVLYCN
jgi:uncharacterized membrane protein YsdA (DUF1294 family)